MPSSYGELATGSFGGHLVLDYTFGIQMLFDAEPTMRFQQYCTTLTELGAKKGAVITVPSVGTVDLSATTALTEGTAVTVERLSFGTVNVTLNEYGRAFGWTGKLDVMTWFELDPIIRRKLVESYTKTADALARAQFFQAASDGTRITVALGPTTAPGTVYPSGTGTGTPTDELTYNVIEHAVDQLKSRDVPAFIDEGGEYYVGIFSPTALRGIKHDPNYRDVYLYGDARTLLRGEQGMIEGVRLLDTTNIPLYDAPGGATDYQQGIIFGMDAVGRGIGMPMELRVEMDHNTDFGRQKAIGWFVIDAYGPLMNAHVQAIHCLAGNYNVR